MKKLTFFICFLLLFSAQTAAQKYSLLILDDEIVDFMKEKSENNFVNRIVKLKLNEVYQPDSLLKKIAGSQAEQLWAKRGGYGAAPQLVKYLKAEDFEFIKQQVTGIRNTDWGYEVGAKQTDKSVYSSRKYYAYSVPVFSMNRKFALRQVDYHCGNLCGWSRLEAFRKSNDNKWEYIGCFLERQF